MSNIPARIKRQEQAHKLPTIGKIKVGEKIENKNQKMIPRSIDYFRATGDYAEEFHRVFGDRPNDIGIVFYTDDESESCFERYECRDGQGKLWLQGNGEVFKIWQPEKEEYEMINLPEMDVREQKKWREKMVILRNRPKHKWSSVLTIKFIIPALSSIVGVWQFDTNAEKSSIPNIRNTFDLVRSSAGTVSHIPMDLKVQMATSQKPGDKSRFPVVSLIPNLSYDKLEEVQKMISSGARAIDVVRQMKISSGQRQRQGIGYRHQEVKKIGTRGSAEANEGQESMFPKED